MKKSILIILLSTMTCALHAETSFFTKAKKIVKKTTKITGYTALGAAFACSFIATSCGLFFLIKDRNHYKVKLTKLALPYVSNVPKVLCKNIVPAGIFAFSASALGSLYATYAMFKKAYKTITKKPKDKPDLKTK